MIVGLQTDAPLKRIVNLYGGKRMAHQSLEQYGYKLNEEIDRHFNEYRKTHNEGVFDAYPKRTRLARTAGLLTGLPDAYGRGRIIGDYRRVALYGIDHLIEEKQKDLDFEDGPMTEDRIRLREEISEQIRALSKMKEMAASYGVDISKPAKMRKKLFRRFIWDILREQKKIMELQLPLDVLLHSLIFILNEILKME